MNRVITLLNVLGVLLLGGLCVVQWRINERQNDQMVALERVNHEQTTKLEEAARAYKACAADLDTFREQVVRTHTNLKDRQTQLVQIERQARQLTAERDQLKKALENWQVAVETRDQRLLECNEKIRRLVSDRDGAIAKYNEIVNKYNATVKDLNAAIGRINTMVAAQQSTDGKDNQTKPR